MIRKHAIVLAMVFLFLGFMFTSVDTPFVNQQNVERGIQETPMNYEQVADGLVPEEPLRLNVIANPGFEKKDSSYSYPDRWPVQTSGHQYIDRAYTDEVANGVYAGYVEGMGGDVQIANAYLRNNPVAPTTDALIEPGISLSFNWNTLSIPDMQAGSSVHLYMMTSDGLGGSRYFMYYLSTGDDTLFNTSSYARFILNETLNQWNSFDRNITEDFISVFGSGVLSSTYYVESLWFYVYSPVGATGMARAIFDDVVLYNTTYTGWIANGDFESGFGLPWSYYATSAGYVSQSTDRASGMYSVNVTVPQVRQGSGFARSYRDFGSTNRYHVVHPGMTTIEVDWKYNDNVSHSAGQYGYLRFEFTNGSAYNLYYYFGYANDNIMATNDTNDCYVKLPGFGVRDTWQHSEFDLYDAASEAGFLNLSIETISFYVYTGMINGYVELLVDNFNMITHPGSDPTFEYDNIVGTNPPFLGWVREVSPHGELTKTTDSHSGLYACNLTTTDDSDGIYRGSIFVELDGALATDFWWKLNHIDSSSSAYAYIDLEFYNSTQFNHIRYILGRSSAWTPPTNPYYKYIEADGFNQTGTWTNLARNITDDFENSFSISSEEWELSGIALHVYSAPGLKVSCLFDDIQFTDVLPPLISNVEQSADPVYYEVTSVSVTATDERPGVSSVIVNYTINGWSSWSTVDASYGTSTYDADIPAQPYGTNVQYYVIASDGCGATAIDNNGGAYYSYTVDDDVDPIFTIDNPVNNTDQEGLLSITVTVDDPGSGVEYVEFNPNGVGPIKDYAAPYQQNWNLDDAALGPHFVIVEVSDNAGNVVTKTHYFTVVDTIDPVLNSPADVEYTVDDIGNIINWSLTENRPNSYEVFVDDVSTYTGTWNESSEYLVIDVDGLAAGDYNYTCVVYDDAGNSASDTVVVTVSAEATTSSTTTTTTTTTPTTSTGTGDIVTPLLIVISIGGVGILLVVFVVLPKMKKN